MNINIIINKNKLPVRALLMLAAVRAASPAVVRCVVYGWLTVVYAVVPVLYALTTLTIGPHHTLVRPSLITSLYRSICESFVEIFGKIHNYLNN